MDLFWVYSLPAAKPATLSHPPATTMADTDVEVEASQAVVRTGQVLSMGFTPPSAGAKNRTVYFNVRTSPPRARGCPAPSPPLSRASVRPSAC